MTVWRRIFKLLYLHMHLYHGYKRAEKACRASSILTTLIPSVSMQNRGRRGKHGNHRCKMRSKCTHRRQPAYPMHRLPASDPSNMNVGRCLKMITRSAWCREKEAYAPRKHEHVTSATCLSLVSHPLPSSSCITHTG